MDKDDLKMHLQNMMHPHDRVALDALKSMNIELQECGCTWEGMVFPILQPPNPVIPEPPMPLSMAVTEEAAKDDIKRQQEGQLESMRQHLRTAKWRKFKEKNPLIADQLLERSRTDEVHPYPFHPYSVDLIIFAGQHGRLKGRHFESHRKYWQEYQIRKGQ